MTQMPLDSIFAPRSVAVVGASEDTNKVGGRTLKFLKSYGRVERVYAVHPTANSIQNTDTYKSVSDLPHPPDLVIVCVPAVSAVEVLREASAMGTAGAIVFAGGFAEQDERGQSLQHEITAIAAKTGMTVLGPNAMGIINQDVFVGTYTTVLEEIDPKAGSTAFVGQSGAVGAYIFTLASDSNVTLGTLVSTGNEAVVDVADCIDRLADHDDVDTLMVYLEGTRDGRKLLRSLRKAKRNGKAVIACKVGRTQEGGRAAASHTANMVGDDDVYEAIFHETGVIRCSDIEQMVHVAQLVEAKVRLPRRRVGVMSFSGGLGVLATDLCVSNGLSLPAFKPETSAALTSIVPFAATSNPVDPTAQGLNDLAVFESMCEIMMRDDNVDAFLLNPGYSLQPAKRGRQIAEAIARATESSGARSVVVGLAEEGTRSVLAEAGIPLYSTLREATEALGLVAGEPEPGPMPEEDDTSSDHRLAELMDAALGAPGPDEARVKDFLRAVGFSVPDGRVVPDGGEGRRAAEEIGYPVAVKAVGPNISHKSELGLVSLGLREPDTVAAEHARISDVLRSQGDHPSGVLVEAMDETSTVAELVVTCATDPSFGHYLVIGMGGVFTELLNDHVVVLPPFTRDRVHESLTQLRGYPVLNGFRGKPGADLGALLEMASRLEPVAEALAARGLELEMNPVAVHEESEGVKILDALITDA
jgi:acyl-CoA synthetase (NDP forming)